LSPWERFRLSAYPIAVAVLAPLVAFLLVWRRPISGPRGCSSGTPRSMASACCARCSRTQQVQADPLLQIYLFSYDALVLLYPASFVTS
jgi:hypothetical protein